MRRRPSPSFISETLVHVERALSNANFSEAPLQDIVEFPLPVLQSRMYNICSVEYT